MLKTEAITLLGGSVTTAADAIGISTSAVSQWPDELPPSIRDRVQAALYRRASEAIKAMNTPTPQEASHG